MNGTLYTTPEAMKRLAEERKLDPQEQTEIGILIALLSCRDTDAIHTTMLDSIKNATPDSAVEWLVKVAQATSCPLDIQLAAVRRLTRVSDLMVRKMAMIDVIAKGSEEAKKEAGPVLERTMKELEW